MQFVSLILLTYLQNALCNLAYRVSITYLFAKCAVQFGL